MAGRTAGRFSRADFRPTNCGCGSWISYEALTPIQKAYLISFNGPFLGELAGRKMAAAEYLERVSPVFERKQRTLLLETAKAYEKVHSTLVEIQKLVPQAEMFLMGEFSPEEIEKFDNYRKVIDLVREAYKEEGRAIALLKDVVGDGS